MARLSSTHLFIEGCKPFSPQEFEELPPVPDFTKPPVPLLVVTIPLFRP